MPLPTSGALSLLNLQNEFGGSNPIGLNEYYAGGGLVPAGTAGSNYQLIPSSGQISINQFYGAPVSTTLGTFDTTSTTILCVQRQSIGPNYAMRHSVPADPGYAPPATEVYVDNAGWLYDGSTGLYYLSLRWSDHVSITSYFLASNVNTVTLTAWGGGGGSGGAWANSGNSPGGGGGYATTTLSKSSGHFSTGQWLHVCAGHGGRGGEDAFYSGYGGGASFAWLTSSNLTGQSTYDKLQTVSTSTLALCAGGGGGGGASNVFSGGGTGSGGGGGSVNSGSNDTGQVSGSNSGANQGSSASHGTQSTGPFSELGAGAAGGIVGYYSGSLTQMGEANIRNLLLTVPQDIVLADQQNQSGFTFVGSGGGGVFMGASGSKSMGGGYGYSSRGAGGGANKVYKGSGSVSTNGASSTPPNATGQVGYGGTGSYGNSGGGIPNKSGNNGFGGRVRVQFS